jgi:hypothetical protein
MSRKRKAASRTAPRSLPITFGNDERADLRLALLSLIIPVLVWLLFLGWNFGDLLGTHDSLGALLQMKLTADGAGWKETLYQWWNFGGGSFLPVGGLPPAVSLLGFLGLDPVGVTSGLHLIGYFGCAFISSRLVIEVAAWFSDDPIRREELRRFSWSRESAIVLLFGFLPILGWRMALGHLYLVSGNWAFLGVTLAFLAGIQRTVTATLTAVLAFLALQVFPVHGMQAVINSVIFGSPIFLLLFWKALRHDARSTLKQAMIAMAIPVFALLAVIPILRLMIDHATGPESMRGPSVNVIYGYLTSEIRDWITSLPWTYELVTPARQRGFHHEVNFPVGPLLVPFVVLLRWRALAVVFGVLTVLVIGLASHWPGISDALLLAFPVLKAFRVSGRAFILLGWLLSIFAVATLVRDLPSRRSRPWVTKDLIWPGATLLLLLLNALAFDGHGIVREALLWTGVAAVTWSIVRSAAGASTAPLPMASGVLAFLAVGAFLSLQERGPFVENQQTSSKNPELLRAEVHRQAPETRHPFHRVAFVDLLPGFFVNTGAISSLGNLDGYFAAPKRFLNLEFGLRAGQFPDPQVSVSRVETSDPAFGVLSALYNVRHLVRMTAGKVQVEPWEQATSFEAAPAWISLATRELADWPAIWRELRETHSAGPYRWKALLRQEAWILSEDRVLAPRFENCRLHGERALFHWSEPRQLPGELELQVSGFEGRCPLTISMNYSKDLRVFAGDRELKTFPSYGALLGVSLSDEEARSPLRIVARAEVPTWALASQVLGILGLVVLTWQSRRKPPLT